MKTDFLIKNTETKRGSSALLIATPTLDTAPVWYEHMGGFSDDEDINQVNAETSK